MKDTFPGPEIINGYPEWEVEKILDSKIKDGGVIFFIKWTGWPIGESTWEPEKHCTHCKAIISEFHKKFPAKRFLQTGSSKTKSPYKVNKARRTGKLP